MNRFLAACAAALALTGPAVASCTINFTVTVPDWYSPRNSPEARDACGVRNPNTCLLPRVEIQLETQRRLGSWQPALLWGSNQPRPNPGTIHGTPGFLPLIGAASRPGDSFIHFLRAELQGAGCVADRQFRVVYRCRVDEGLHRRFYSRFYAQNAAGYREATQVLFSGNRVSAQRDITFVANCPSIG